MKNHKTILVILSYLFLGLGFSFLISPVLLYWFIHGNYERYLWIISGPYPFDGFGSGTFQLALFTGLFIAGAVLTIAGAICKKQKNL